MVEPLYGTGWYGSFFVNLHIDVAPEVRKRLRLRVALFSEGLDEADRSCHVVHQLFEATFMCCKECTKYSRKLRTPSCLGPHTSCHGPLSTTKTEHRVPRPHAQHSSNSHVRRRSERVIVPSFFNTANENNFQQPAREQLPGATDDRHSVSRYLRHVMLTRDNQRHRKTSLN